MSVLKITGENFENEVLKADKPVIVDFYADWCGPCKMKVGKVNSDEEMELAEQFGIMSIPTIMIFKNGAVSKTFVGVTAKNDIVEATK